MPGADAGGSRTYSLDPSAGGASFARLLFALLKQRFTGTLAVEQRAPAGERRVWLRGGMPVFCDWHSPDDLLGELLIEAGVLQRAQLEQALEDQEMVGGLLGELMVEQGMLDEMTLTSALRTQCKRKLVHLFGAHATEGSVVVTAGEHDKGKGGLGQLNVLELLTRGVKRHYSPARVEAEIGDALGGDLVATPAFVRYEAQFGFAREDAAILGAIGRGVTRHGVTRHRRRVSGEHVDCIPVADRAHRPRCCHHRSRPDRVRALRPQPGAARNDGHVPRHQQLDVERDSRVAVHVPPDPRRVADGACRLAHVRLSADSR